MSNYSAGGNRVFSFEDILAALDQKAENAIEPSITTTDEVSQLATAPETTKTVDSMTLTASAAATWGSGSYGEVRWT